VWFTGHRVNAQRGVEMFSLPDVWAICEFFQSFDFLESC